MGHFLAPVRLVPVQVVPDKNPRWSVDASDIPIVSVKVGEEIEVETLDCRAGTIQSQADLARVPDASHINPITGPIEITGVQSGSVVSIEITAIERRGEPLMLVRPGVTAFDFVDGPALEFPQVHHHSISVCGTSIPLNPMVGFIATTPAEGRLASSGCGYTGGNLDAPMLLEGAELLLPVEVDGAGLFLGDVHLSQGDGELFLTGVESPATVRLICRSLTGMKLPGPVIVSEQKVAVIGCGATLDAAAAEAANRAVALLGRAFVVSSYECGFLLSAVGNLAVCRYLPNYGSVCRVEIPQDVLRQLPARSEEASWLVRSPGRRG